MIICTKTKQKSKARLCRKSIEIKIKMMYSYSIPRKTEGLDGIKACEKEVFVQKVCIKDKKRQVSLLFMYIDKFAIEWYNKIVIRREQKHGITANY